MASRLIDFIVVEENDQHFDHFKQAFDHFKFEGRLLRLRCLSELADLLEDPGRAELDNFKPRLILLAVPRFEEKVRQFLEARKQHPYFRKIPLIVLMGAGLLPEDKRAFYECGVNSVVLKPQDPNGYIQLVEVIGRYWFSVVMLPTSD